jgi:hypothetical protein
MVITSSAEMMQHYNTFGPLCYDVMREAWW